jgi:hypothetical protein
MLALSAFDIIFCHATDQLGGSHAKEIMAQARSIFD